MSRTITVVAAVGADGDADLLADEPAAAATRCSSRQPLEGRQRCDHRELGVELRGRHGLATGADPAEYGDVTRGPHVQTFGDRDVRQQGHDRYGDDGPVQCGRRHKYAGVSNLRIEELRRRIQKDPASIAFAQLAEEHRRAGQLEDAVRVCRAGLAQHPAYLSARITLGRALLEMAQYDEAVTEFEYVLKAAPDNLTAVRELADIEQRRRARPASRQRSPTAPTVARESRAGAGRRIRCSPSSRRGWRSLLKNVSLGLPGSDVLAARHVRVRRALEALGLDALIVTTPANIRYLTNHVGTAGTLARHADAMSTC